MASEGDYGTSRCPACGESLPADHRFCTRCGTRLALGDDSPTTQLEPVSVGPASVGPLIRDPPAAHARRGRPYGVFAALAFLAIGGSVAAVILLGGVHHSRPPPAAAHAASKSQTAASAQSTQPNTAAGPAGSADIAGQAEITAPSPAPDSVDSVGHPVSYHAGNLVDSDPTTCWRMTGSGVGRQVVFRLPQPRVITSVGLINGYAKTDPNGRIDRYFQDRRITRVTWGFDDGTILTQSLDPARESVQSISPSSPVKSGTITLRIDSVSGSEPGYDYTAISEVDVEGR